MLISVLVLACNNNKEHGASKEQVYSGVLPNVYDSIYQQVGNPKGKDILINPFDDHLDSLTISHALQNIDSTQSEDYKLIKALSFKLNDQPTFKFESLPKTGAINLISEKNSIDKYHYNKDVWVGSSTISDIIFDDNQQRGVFYIDLQCGKSCGAGYLVFVKLEEDHWKVDRLMPMWY